MKTKTFPYLEKNADETQVCIVISKTEKTEFFSDRVLLIDAIRQKNFLPHQTNALITEARNCRKMQDLVLNPEKLNQISTQIIEEANQIGDKTQEDKSNKVREETNKEEKITS